MTAGRSSPHTADPHPFQILHRQILHRKRHSPSFARAVIVLTALIAGCAAPPGSVEADIEAELEANPEVDPEPVSTAQFSANLRPLFDPAPLEAPYSNERGRVGLSLVPRNYSSSKDAWLQVLGVARALGADVVQLPSGYWHEQETVPGAYRWDGLAELLSAVDQLDLEVEGVQDLSGVFFHDRSVAPRHLEHLVVGDAELTAAYTRFVLAYLEQAHPFVRTVLVHAEGCTSYFRSFPERADGFIELLRTVRAAVGSRYPDVGLGVNTDPHCEPRILRRIASATDVMGFDLLRIDDELQTPDQVGSVLDRLLEISGTTPIAVAAYWSTSPQHGPSAERMQVEFFRAAFRHFRENRERYAYLAPGSPFDDDVAIVGPALRHQFETLPKDFVEEIVGSVTRLGLITAEGTPKPALWEVHRQIAAIYGEDAGTLQSTTARRSP